MAFFIILRQIRKAKRGCRSQIEEVVLIKIPININGASCFLSCYQGLIDSISFIFGPFSLCSCCIYLLLPLILNTANLTVGFFI
mgnify:FL=1